MQQLVTGPAAHYGEKMHPCQAISNAPIAESEQALLHYLRDRVPPDVVRRRLELERCGPEPVFDFRNLTLNPENWSGFAPLLRTLLQWSGLYQRGRRNALALTVRERPLGIRGLPDAFRGYRILQISDPHIDMCPEFADTLKDALVGVSADLCVLTGDFRFRTTGDMTAALKGMERLVEALPAPGYAVLGNHDSLGMLPGMEAAGVRVLFNEGTDLMRGGETVWLAGVDDPHYFGLQDLNAAQAGRSEGTAALLLAHSPELHAEAAAAGYQAVLCGHTHGGQICLPGGIPILTSSRCSRRYCRGDWKDGDLNGYTSTGAGSSVLDVRFNSPAEVVVHVLNNELQAL